MKKLKYFARLLYYKLSEFYSYALYYLLNNKINKKRVIIFGQGRSGTTLLEDLIQSTGYFQENGELLNTDRGEVKNPFKFIQGMSNKNNSNFIFHAKIYQLVRDRKNKINPNKFLLSLQDNSWKIIYLRRENKVKHAMSNVVAKERGKYHKYNDVKESFSIDIDCNDFVKKVQERFDFEQDEKRALKGIKYHEVVYEQDLEDSSSHQKTIDNILSYLQLESKTVITKHKKVNTQDFKKLIKNYDEFISCINENNWEYFV